MNLKTVSLRQMFIGLSTMAIVVWSVTRPTSATVYVLQFIFLGMSLISAWAAFASASYLTRVVAAGYVAGMVVFDQLRYGDVWVPDQIDLAIQEVWITIVGLPNDESRIRILETIRLYSDIVAGSIVALVAYPLAVRSAGVFKIRTGYRLGERIQRQELGFRVTLAFGMFGAIGCAIVLAYPSNTAVLVCYGLWWASICGLIAYSVNRASPASPAAGVILASVIVFYRLSFGGLWQFEWGVTAIDGHIARCVSNGFPEFEAGPNVSGALRQLSMFIVGAIAYALVIIGDRSTGRWEGNGGHADVL
jgi:hypothetical protein